MSLDIKNANISNSENKGRSASLINQKVRMDGKNNTTDPLRENTFTPYGKMHNEDDYDPYRDDISDAHNISIAEAVEEECDITKTVWGSLLVLLMITIIFLVVYFRSFFMDQIQTYVDYMTNSPITGVLIYFVIMTLMISSSVPSAIPQIFGSYVFVQAFGFIKGFWIFVFLDYFAMLIGWIPPFYASRYLMKSWVNSYISDKTKLLALSRALTKNAKKLVALMRVWTLTPYVVFNIVWGITDMTVIDYTIGNLTIIGWDGPYIYIWCSISKITNSVSIDSTSEIVEIVVVVISVIIVIVVTIFVYRTAQEEADKIVEMRRSSAIARKTRSRVGVISELAPSTPSVKIRDDKEDNFEQNKNNFQVTNKKDEIDSTRKQFDF